MAKTPLEPRDLRHTSEPLRGERTEHTTRRGPVSTEPQRRRRGMGWLWALLGLLAVALVAALALGLFDGDDDGGQTAGQAQGTAEQGAGSAQEAAGTGTGSTATDAGGAMTAGGTSILPPPGSGLADYVGRDATGKSVIVQSVGRNAENNRLAGFWVGSGEQDRVYVEWGGTVGPDEADYTPKVGEKVNLTGPVRPAPENPETALELNSADAELVRTQRGYVNADTVSPAQS
jgi:hypothetical protein